MSANEPLKEPFEENDLGQQQRNKLNEFISAMRQDAIERGNGCKLIDIYIEMANRGMDRFEITDYEHTSLPADQKQMALIWTLPESSTFYIGRYIEMAHQGMDQFEITDYEDIQMADTEPADEDDQGQQEDELPDPMGKAPEVITPDEVITVPTIPETEFEQVRERERNLFRVTTGVLVLTGLWMFGLLVMLWEGKIDATDLKDLLAVTFPTLVGLLLASEFFNNRGD